MKTITFKAVYLDLFPKIINSQKNILQNRRDFRKKKLGEFNLNCNQKF